MLKSAEKVPFFSGTPYESAHFKDENLFVKTDVFSGRNGKSDFGNPPFFVLLSSNFLKIFLKINFFASRNN